MAARAYIIRDCGSGGAGCSERAKELLLKATAKNPRQIEGYVLLAHHAMNGGCAQCADPFLVKARALQPEHPQYLGALGRLDLMMGNGRSAERNLLASVSVEANPKKRVQTYMNLAQVYTAAPDKLDLAENAYRKAIESNPAGAWPHGNLGGFLVCGRGNYDAAIPELKKALSIMDYGRARGYLALAQYERWGQTYLKDPRAPATAEAFGAAQKEYPDLSGIFVESLSCAGAGRAARAMLQAGMVEKGIINEPIAEGLTPLGFAVKNNNTEFALYLLSSGANPNVRMAGGLSPLMYAAHLANEELVSALLAKRADANAVHGNGDSVALMAVDSFASDEKVMRIVARLDAAKADFHYFAAPRKVNAVFIAASSGKPTVLKWLLSKGVNRSLAPVGSSLDPMIGAIFNGHLSTVQALIDAGVPLDPPGISTPYDRFAENYGKKEIADFIRKARGVKG
jgi:Flp pilus assembly protein TadD